MHQHMGLGQAYAACRFRALPCHVQSGCMPHLRPHPSVTTGMPVGRPGSASVEAVARMQSPSPSPPRPTPPPPPTLGGRGGHGGGDLGAAPSWHGNLRRRLAARKRHFEQWHAAAEKRRQEQDARGEAPTSVDRATLSFLRIPAGHLHAVFVPKTPEGSPVCSPTWIARTVPEQPLLPELQPWPRLRDAQFLSVDALVARTIAMREERNARDKLLRGHAQSDEDEDDQGDADSASVEGVPRAELRLPPGVTTETNLPGSLMRQPKVRSGGLLTLFEGTEWRI